MERNNERSRLIFEAIRDGDPDWLARVRETWRRSRALSASVRVPDFFVVGHAKSGTTALYEMLRRHPQVFMPNLKEPWFFARDNPILREMASVRSRSPVESAKASRTICRCLPAREPISAWGGLDLVSLVSKRAVENRGVAARRSDHRDVSRARELSEISASAAARSHEETEKSFRKAVELEGARRENRNLPKYAYWPQTLIYTDRSGMSSSCTAT